MEGKGRGQKERKERVEGVDRISFAIRKKKENSKKQQKKKTEEFLAAQNSCLKTLDLFAGCGSFSLDMKNIAGVNTTHAIEISPSAAQTLKYI